MDRLNQNISFDKLGVPHVKSEGSDLIAQVSPVAYQQVAAGLLANDSNGKTLALQPFLKQQVQYQNLQAVPLAQDNAAFQKHVFNTLQTNQQAVQQDIQAQINRQQQSQQTANSINSFFDNLNNSGSITDGQQSISNTNNQAPILADRSQNQRSNTVTSHNSGSFMFNNPFFDIDNLPLTNPPIYEPDVLAGVVRRRVSISNGQIGQLIEAHDYPDSDDSQPTSFPSDASQPTPFASESGSNIQPLANVKTLQNNSGSVSTNNNAQYQFSQTPQQPLFNQVLQPTGQAPTLSAATASSPSQQPVIPGSNLNVAFQPQNPVVSPHNHLIQPDPSLVAPRMAQQMHPHIMVSQHNGPMPGTAAWKRARLLERNRVAASKCRHKKKIAQQQLQEEAEIAAKENATLKKRVAYLENTLDKVKDVMRNHMKSCNGSSLSIDILEDFLKLDEESQKKVSVEKKQVN